MKEFIDYLAEFVKKRAYEINDVNEWIKFLVEGFMVKNSIKLLNEALDILGCKEKNDMVKIWQFLKE